MTGQRALKSSRGLGGIFARPVFRMISSRVHRRRRIDCVRGDVLVACRRVFEAVGKSFDINYQRQKEVGALAGRGVLRCKVPAEMTGVTLIPH